ncbi:MAG: DUF1800 domain-containing protein, partial [Chitinophagaceae bacterium]
MPPPSSGLTPYKENLDFDDVVHLLKRTLFGATKSNIDLYKNLPLSQILNQIIPDTVTFPSPPVKEYTPAATTLNPDTSIALGTTWVNNVNNDGTVNALRRASFKKWSIGVMLNQSPTIQEKMTLFWHNLLATESNDVGNANYVFKHFNMLRSYSWGNYKNLIKDLLLDPAMLVYLNGQLNNKNSPDENLGRELLELFTCGKGPNSLFTENDVKATARVLTGWRNNANTLSSYFTLSLHDTANKQFSSFFNNTTIVGRNNANAGIDEINDLINMIFSVEEVSKYLCRRLYRWFVYYEIDATVEANIIAPLAQLLRNNNYEVRPVLLALFKSEHFFDIQVKGCQIKSPIDLVIGMCREFGVQFPPESDYVKFYGHCNYLVTWTNNMQQSFGDPPDVSGWKAYYQEPQYYQSWISADTLPKRNQFTDTMIVNGYTLNSFKIQIDGVEFAKKLSNPGNPNILIDESILYLYRLPLSATAKAQIKKDILLSGQSQDYYWTDAWNTFIANPNNTANANNVKTKLRELYKYLMNLAEYQLS